MVPGGVVQFDASGVRDSSPTPTQFSYDAVEDKGKRKAPRIDHRSEDKILDSSGRSRMTSNARDLVRNFAIAAWGVRRHLDYLTSFSFHSRTGNDQVDATIERLTGDLDRPYRFDVAARHGRSRMLRLAEARRTIDGDCGLIKVSKGFIQGLEGDRVRDPSGIDVTGEWVQGVKVDPAGRALAYAVHKRCRGYGLEFERTVSASNMCWFAYYDRFDQVRGVSPLASALNPLRDVYENFDYALAKAKVTQLFAMAILRKASDSAGLLSVEEADDAETDEPEGPRYKVDFGKGPVLLDMDPGDDAKFLESSHPSSQFRDFTLAVIQAALKALDIPFSFYDESHTNFFGSRAAWMHYDRACKPKREDVLELLRQIQVFFLQTWILDGRLELPRGWNVGDLEWEFVPAGMPWWDPAKEVNGDLAAIRAGLTTPQRLCKEHGTGDWFDNIDEISIALEHANAKKVPVSFDFAPQAPVEVVSADN